MQEFFLIKGSTNPLLEMELIDDGRYNFQKSLLNYALQDSVITFTMIDIETNLPKINKAKANIVCIDNDACDEQYILQYKWTNKDVNREGIFKGFFEIKFNGNIKSNDMIFPEGNLIVPIENELRIIIK